MKSFFMSKLFFVALATIIIAPGVASAAFFSSNEVVEVDQPIKDDAFLAGKHVTVNESIQDDAYLAGETLEVKKAVGEDLFAAGNSVTIKSNVGDDGFLAGDRVVVDNGSSVDDLFAAGRSIELRQGTTVKGDAYLAGADITLNGRVEGDVRVMSESVEVGPEATITGSLIVRGEHAPTIADGAHITGSVQYIPVTPHAEKTSRFLIARWVRDVVTLFVVSLLLLYLAPRLSALVLERVYTSTLSSFGIGFVWMVAFIPAVILLLITIIGWPVAAVVVFLTGLLFTLSAILMPLVVGAWLAGKLTARVKISKPWQQVLLGAVVVVSLHFIPAFGPLVVCVLMLVITGVLIRALKQNA